MIATSGYYDGSTIKIIDEVPIKPNQKVIITVLDEFVSEKPVKKSAFGCFSTGEKLSDDEIEKRMELESKAWEEAIGEKYENS